MFGAGVYFHYVCYMNWKYISGFFDADGSISFVKAGNSKNETVQVSFHNTEYDLIVAIQFFIFKELGFKGTVTSKPPKKETHAMSYDLKYVYQQGYQVACKLESIHPKKKHRISVYRKIQAATVRNGKYTDEQAEYRKQLGIEFHKHLK